MQKLTRVTVFGAMGAQGSPVVRQLLNQNVAVKAVSRDAAKVEQLYRGKAIAVAADLNDADALEKAFADVDAAFFHLPIPHDPSVVPQQLTNVLNAAKRANLPRLVFSTTGTTTDNMPPIAFVENNRAAAKAVLNSSIPSVVLRPTIYLENLLHFSLHEIKAGVLTYPPLNPNRKISWTAQEDQATLAIAAMTAENAISKQFDIATPEPLTGNELAELLMKKIGREIVYKPLAPNEFGANLAKFAGEAAGKGIAELYEATDNLSANGAIINMKPVLAVLPVKLTTVSEWIERQEWN